MRTLLRPLLLAGLLLAAIAAVAPEAVQARVNVRNTAASAFNITFSPMAAPDVFSNPQALAFGPDGTAYILDNGVVFSTSPDSKVGLLYSNPYAATPVWMAANAAAAAHNQLYIILKQGDLSGHIHMLYRLDTSNPNVTAKTEITFDAPGGADPYSWVSGTFVDGQLFAVVEFVGANSSRTALLVLTFANETDTRPVAQFLPLVQDPALPQGIQWAVGGLHAMADNFYMASDNDTSIGAKDNAIYRIKGDDLRTAMAASQPNQWGASVPATLVLQGTVARGSIAMRAVDVYPVATHGRELLLIADAHNGAVLAWDPTAPLNPDSNPMSFPVGPLPVDRRSLAPTSFAVSKGIVYCTVNVPQFSSIRKGNWMQMHINAQNHVKVQLLE